MYDYLSTNTHLQCVFVLSIDYILISTERMPHIINELSVHYNLFQVCVYQLKKKTFLPWYYAILKFASTWSLQTERLKFLSWILENLTYFYKNMHSNVSYPSFNKINFLKLYFVLRYRTIIGII